MLSVFRSALLDSGSAGSFMDEVLMETLGIHWDKYAPSLKIHTINSQLIGEGIVELCYSSAC